MNNTWVAQHLGLLPPRRTPTEVKKELSFFEEYFHIS